MVSIKGLDKAKCLKALYDHSHIQGMSFFGAFTDNLTLNDCRDFLEKPSTSITSMAV